LHPSAYFHFDRQRTANSVPLDTFFMLAVKFAIREAAIAWPTRYDLLSYKTYNSLGRRIHRDIAIIFAIFS
jgi:hypothetical protein